MLAKCVLKQNLMNGEGAQQYCHTYDLNPHPTKQGWNHCHTTNRVRTGHKRGVSPHLPMSFELHSQACPQGSTGPGPDQPHAHENHTNNHFVCWKGAVCARVLWVWLMLSCLLCRLEGKMHFTVSLLTLKKSLIKTASHG